MADTQWPNFVVFQQEREGQPHQHAGSVHAPDAELALMNARDVFVRRPACVSLWVARVDQVYASTAEELQASERKRVGEVDDSGEQETYLVFLKLNHKGALTHVGQVQGRNSAQALEAAIKRHANSKALVWWLIPERAIHRTDPGQAESLFAPAEDKHFRRQTDFHTLTQKRAIKTRSDERGSDGG